LANQTERRNAHAVEISVPGVIEIFKEIESGPEKLFEPLALRRAFAKVRHESNGMIRFNVEQEVANYLSQLLHKEFKPGTGPIEIVAGEVACHRLQAFISLKMELHLENKSGWDDTS
jgi:hypothetical protein